ncbi:unnamed protein product [Auanema sp. JU1783]|nr:unnamed protein product [Auanema sp. JU1783]
MRSTVCFVLVWLCLFSAAVDAQGLFGSFLGAPGMGGPGMGARRFGPGMGGSTSQSIQYRGGYGPYGSSNGFGQGYSRGFGK